jgi:catechol 2,3-dioxygenase-like lactoylglutathione lyase family enzyme
MPNVSGLSHVDLTVSDVERSAAWYQKSLGLRQVHESNPPEMFAGRTINMVEPSSGLIISVVQHERAEPGAFSEFRVGLDHLARPSSPATTSKPGSSTSNAFAFNTQGLPTCGTGLFSCSETLTASSWNWRRSRPHRPSPRRDREPTTRDRHDRVGRASQHRSEPSHARLTSAYAPLGS